MVALYELMEVLPDSFEPTFTNRVNELFCFLRNQKGKLSNIQAVESFLGGTLNNKYFSKIKNELKRQLVKYIIANPDVWMEVTRRGTYESCHKKFTAYKILLMNGKREAAIEIAKNLLPNLRKLELYGLTYQVATDLRFHHSTMDVSSNEVRKYDRLAQKQLGYLKAEAIVRSYYSGIALIHSTKASFTEPISVER